MNHLQPTGHVWIPRNIVCTGLSYFDIISSGYRSNVSKQSNFHNNNVMSWNVKRYELLMTLHNLQGWKTVIDSRGWPFKFSTESNTSLFWQCWTKVCADFNILAVVKALWWAYTYTYDLNMTSLGKSWYTLSLYGTIYICSLNPQWGYFWRLLLSPSNW